MSKFYYPICVLCPFAEGFSPSKKMVDCHFSDRIKSVGQCDILDDWIKVKGKNHPKFEEWKKHQLRLNKETNGRLLRLSDNWKQEILNGT